MWGSGRKALNAREGCRTGRIGGGGMGRGERGSRREEGGDSEEERKKGVAMGGVGGLG